MRCAENRMKNFRDGISKQIRKGDGMKINIDPTVVVVEGDEMKVRTKFCHSIAKDIAEGRDIITINIIEDLGIMFGNIRPQVGDDLVNKVVVVPDADSLIPARMSASKKNLLVSYLVSQRRKTNLRWVFGCRDFNKIEIRVRKQYDLMVKVR